MRVLIAALILLTAPAAAHAAQPCQNPAGDEGDQVYNITYHVMQYCNGRHWVAMGSVMGQGDNLGDHAAEQALDMAGFRIENLAPPTADNHAVTRAYVTSALAASWPDCTIGQVAARTVNGWGCANMPQPEPDTTPDAFSFTDQSNVTLSTLIYSNIITISGINSPASVAVSGNGTPYISINGGAWAASGTIEDGQTLRVRLTSSSSANTTFTATVTVGGVSDSWTVRTGTSVANCAFPDGGTISVGGTVAMFKNQVYGCNEACEFEMRTCLSDGSFSGDPSFTQRNCSRAYNCSAVTVGGYKWYLGQSGESCDTVCGKYGRGGCNLAGTRGYAGSGGSAGQCGAVMTALNAGQTGGIAWTTGSPASNAPGCMIRWAAMTALVISNNPTTCDTAPSGYSRACACNN